MYIAFEAQTSFVTICSDCFDCQGTRIFIASFRFVSFHFIQKQGYRFVCSTRHRASLRLDNKLIFLLVLQLIAMRQSVFAPMIPYGVVCLSARTLRRGFHSSGVAVDSSSSLVRLSHTRVGSGPLSSMRSHLTMARDSGGVKTGKWMVLRS